MTGFCATHEQSVTNRTYVLERGTGLSPKPSFVTLVSNLVGQAVVTTYLDTNSAALGPRLYRVGVRDYGE